MFHVVKFVNLSTFENILLCLMKVLVMKIQSFNPKSYWLQALGRLYCKVLHFILKVFSFRKSDDCQCWEPQRRQTRTGYRIVGGWRSLVLRWPNMLCLLSSPQSDIGSDFVVFKNIIKVIPFPSRSSRWNKPIHTA